MSGGLRIAYLCHYFVPEPAAPAARVHELSRAWVAAGHSVTVLTAFPNFPTGSIPPHYHGRLWAEEHLDGIRVLRSWVHARPNRGVGPRATNHLSFMVSSVALGLPRLGPLDIVIASSPTLFSAVSAWLIARIRRVPFVLEIRDLWPDAFVEMGVMRPGPMVGGLRVLARFLYRQANHIVVVTRGFADRLCQQGVPSEKITVIPNGVDTRLFHPHSAPLSVRAGLGIAPEAFVAAYVGSHGLAHGLDAILDTAALLPDVTFLFVGDGAARPALLARREADRLTNVHLHPSVAKSAVAELYAAADVCLVPLRNVPILGTFLPSKMFEIMGAGRPIVAALTGEGASLLHESGAAMVVPPEDGPAIAAALRRLQQDSALRADMGRRGRDFVTRNFDRDALARQYVDLLLRITRRA